MIKRFLAIGSLTLFMGNLKAQDVFYTPGYKSFHLKGYIGQKIDACIEKGIKKTDEQYLVAPFRQRNENRQWQTEFWGKWFTSAADAYRYTKDAVLKTKLDNAVKGLLATQSADGYIGNYAPQYRLQQWDIWGMKYCLLGLLDYYAITEDKKILVAMQRLADYAINAIRQSGIPLQRLGNYKGMAAASILEPIVKLYAITKIPRYLDFANVILASWEAEGGAGLISKALQGVPVGKRFPVPAVWYGPDNGQKAYEMMSCYEGVLELYRITGNKNYLQAVIAAANDIRKTEIMITGSGASMECWFGGTATQSVPAKHTMEACVTVTWLKLCLQLLRITGDGQWANEIEKSYYNALLGTMKPDGSTWSKYIGMKGEKLLGEDQCGMTTNCCIANGPRGILLATKESIMTSPDGIVVNFYNSLHSELQQGKNNKSVAVEVQTDYPISNEAIIKITPRNTGAFTLRLRIPEWSKTTKIIINGKEVGVDRQNAYAVINRIWRPGDVVTISFDMEVRPFILKTDPSHYALLYGPLVLAADKRFQQTPFYECYTPAFKNGKLPFKVTAGTRQYQNLLSVTVPVQREVNGLQQKTEELVLTDFASAGNTWDAAAAYTVWLQQQRDVSKGQ